MSELLQPGTPEFAAEIERLGKIVSDTEKRYRPARPPRPSQRALRHRRENAAARAKKQARKRTRR